MPNQGELTRHLSHEGYRLTPQRLMVLEAVEQAEDHISAEEIYALISARYPNVNISTVYRTLELLKEHGLVTETDMGDDRVRYHSIKKGHHHHLVCTECGRVIEVDEAALAALKQSLAAKYQFEADLHHLAIFGRCKDCRHQDKT